MSDHYDVTTCITPLPSEHVQEWHRLALDAVGFSIDDSNAYGMMLYTPRQVGTGQIAIEAGGRWASPDHAWVSFLRETGLDAHADQAFVQRLREACTSRKTVDWDDVVRMVLQDLPAEAVPHVDFTGAFFGEKERAGDFGGFAVRVTREISYSQESPEQFFKTLDERAALAQAGTLEHRIEAATRAVTEEEVSLGDALRSAFPECKSGDESVYMAEMLHDSVSNYIGAWARRNAPESADDEVASLRP